MSWMPHNIGLYADTTLLEEARAGRAQAPVLWGWLFLTAAAGTPLREVSAPVPGNRKATEPILRRVLNAHEQALLDAFAWRYADDAAAGANAVAVLQTGFGFTQHTAPLAEVQELVSAAQMMSLVQDHPAFVPFANEWRSAFHEHVAALLAVEPSQVDLLAWKNLLAIVAGIVLHDETLFRHGTDGVQAMIHTIHPEGYIAQSVQSADIATFERVMTIVSALVLSAEAATRAGVALWDYENRGVSIMTTVAYIVYYYYYPEKWKWATGITAEMAKEAFITHGAFLEIAEQHTSLPGSALILGELRPMFSLADGGATTLSHAGAPIPPRRKRGWLWG